MHHPYCLTLGMRWVVFSFPRVTKLMREKCHTPMLHNDMNLCSLMLYAQSIQQSTLYRTARNMKTSGQSDQSQPGPKNKFSSKDEPRSAKVKLQRGSGTKEGKHTCATCVKRQSGECQQSTGSCIGYGIYGHKVRNFPTREGKKVSSNVSIDDAPMKRHFQVLWTRGAQLIKVYDNDGKLLLFSLQLYEFLQFGGVW